MGSKSTTILFGSRVRALLILVGSCFIILLVIAGILNKHGWPFFAISIGGTATHLAWQFYTVDLDIPESCWGKGDMANYGLSVLILVARELQAQRISWLANMGWFDVRLQTVAQIINDVVMC